MVEVNAPVQNAPTHAGGEHVAELAGRLLEKVRATLAEDDWGGLRTSHFRVLSNTPATGATITELSGRLFMTKQAVGQFVTHLQGTGHLDVLTDAVDRRRRVVVRTRLGDDTIERLGAVIAELERRWEQQVGVQSYRQFRHVLRQIALEA